MKYLKLTLVLIAQVPDDQANDTFDYYKNSPGDLIEALISDNNSIENIELLNELPNDYPKENISDFSNPIDNSLEDIDDED